MGSAGGAGLGPEHLETPGKQLLGLEAPREGRGCPTGSWHPLRDPDPQPRGLGTGQKISMEKGKLRPGGLETGAEGWRGHCGRSRTTCAWIRLCCPASGLLFLSLSFLACKMGPQVLSCLCADPLWAFGVCNTGMAVPAPWGSCRIAGDNRKCAA